MAIPKGRKHKEPSRMHIDSMEPFKATSLQQLGLKINTTTSLLAYNNHRLLYIQLINHTPLLQILFVSGRHYARLHSIKVGIWATTIPDKHNFRKLEPSAGHITLKRWENVISKRTTFSKTDTVARESEKSIGCENHHWSAAQPQCDSVQSGNSDRRKRNSSCILQ